MEHSNLIEKLTERNLLTLVDDKICVKPDNQYDFTTYPINENDCILVTIDEYIGLLMQVYMFNEQLNGVVDYIAPIDEEITETGEEQ